jgi:lipopolysaccharide/colanic/teichoic acid biosynthesis glycosyltransferase
MQDYKEQVAMQGNSLAAWWLSISGRPNCDGTLLKSCAELEDALRQERLRVDRSGGEFSLVRFSLQLDRAQANVLRSFEAALRARLRATDIAGRLPDGRIGIVLPGTAAAGAWVVADSVRALMPPGVEPVEFEVYEYPTRARDTDPTDGGEVKQQPDPATASELPYTDGAPGETGEALEAGPPRPVHSIESLFVQPLPWWKRLLDVVCAGLALVLLSPLLLIVAIAIKLSMPGPVFFSQKRAGLGGRPFSIYKLRTMVVNAEALQKELLTRNEQDGPAFKIKDDPRVTPLGRFLRRSSIDELPQLWNVLMGDMTLVGPRPLPMHEAEGCTGWQRRRMEVTPGLTCIWQIEGRSRVTFDEWVRMDLRYASNRSIATDLDLIVRTVPAVLTKKGAC